jgi:hypothetical protein
MRTIVIMLLAVVPCFADISTDIKQARATLDSLLRIQSAEGCARMSVWMQASIDSSLALHEWGLTAYPDARDSLWVELELPLSGASADKRMVILGAMQEYLEAGAQVISSSRVRDYWLRAWKGKERLRLLVETAQ